LYVLLLPLIVGITALLGVIYLVFLINRENPGTAAMTKIADLIRIGMRAYLSRQSRTILYFIPVLAVVIWLFLSSRTAVAFLCGTIFSLLAGYVGMNLSNRASVRSANSARNSSSKAFRLAFLGGGVMGLSVTGLSLIGLYILYVAFGDLNSLVGFGFGASLSALFAQIGGGIYTKAADIGADLVGKLEASMPEDDPRNPAVIADLVGDNVGDCAGRGSDLFQSFSDDIVTGMLIGLAYMGKYGEYAIVFPLILQAVGVLASMIGIYATRTWRGMKPSKALSLGFFITALLAATGSYILSTLLLQDFTIFLATLSGILATTLAVFITRYYTSMGPGPVGKMAEASERGAAINIITGIAYGLQSSILPVIGVVGAIVFSFIVSGYSLYAIVMANIGTDLMIGFIMASDTFGPIIDNADGIAEMSGLSEEISGSLETLDAVGNTMKASTKAYAMASGTITAFVIFATFFHMVGINSLNVSEPFDLAILFIGVGLPFLIASLVIGSTGKTSYLMVDEVRRQFREKEGILEGKVEPDYARCIDISTKNALKEMILPGLLAILPPMLVGLLFRGEGLGMMLIGAIASAAFLGPFFSNVGAAFDNAKKMIETGYMGGKGSVAHKAAIVGDTVGDPFKDVAGPSLLIFMKLMGMSALLIAPLLIAIR
jgi:K(+)-stimulated pyrophosphate-energized sodium pump